MNIPKDIPVIIPRYAADFHYVRSFIRLNKQITERPIIWQGPDDYIQVKRKTFVLKNFSFPREAIEYTLNSFYDCSFLQNRGERKIYLKRSANKQRSVSNALEVENFLIKKGYQVIDSETMTLEKQIEIFSSASEIIGLHGAGLTNIIFRKGRNLKLKEIFPHGHEPDHYETLSRLFDFQYSKVTGMPLDERLQFILPLDRLMNAIS